MTHLTDDELGTLLRETFTDHEHLADPERAVALTTEPAPRPHRGRALLAAAAAVALVAVGTSYVVTRGSDTGRPSADPTRSPGATGQPPLPALQTDAGNRAAAVREAARVTAALPVLPGAVETDRSGVPELDGFGVSLLTPTGHTITRSRWWTVSGTTSKAAALWYAAHPPPGFSSEGGATGVGGSGDGNRWVDEVTWDGSSGGTTSRTSVEVQTTGKPGGAGIRLTVLTVWPPARPLTSYVQDVSSIDVQSSHVHVGRHGRTVQRTYTVSDPARVLRAATAYNALAGMTPMIHSCPMQTDSYTDRITFHTATGDVVTVDRSQACGFGMSVRRDGHPVNPPLGDPAALFTVLGLHR